MWGLNAIVSRGEKSAAAFNLLVSFRLGNFLSNHRSPEHLDTWTYAIGDSSRAICIESANDTGRTVVGRFIRVGESTTAGGARSRWQYYRDVSIIRLIRDRHLLSF